MFILESPGGLTYMQCLTTAKKNWAKGSRDAFLTSRLPSYSAAILQSNSRAGDCIDTIVNQYFSVYHWTIPPSEEPVKDASPIIDGVLTEEEQARKKEVIAQMKKVCPTILSFL